MAQVANGTATAAQGAGLLLAVLDTRQRGKPKQFSGENARMEDWKFQVLNYVALVSFSLLSFLEAARIYLHPIPKQKGDERRDLSTLVLAVLARNLSGHCLRIPTEPQKAKWIRRVATTIAGA
jgi:hypothetical protein